MTTGKSGNPNDENGRTSEVVDLFNPDRKCNHLENATPARFGSVGGLLNGKPLVCGGSFKSYRNALQDCFLVNGNKNIPPISMTQKRTLAAAVVLKGKLFLHYYFFSSSDLIAANG